MSASQRDGFVFEEEKLPLKKTHKRMNTLKVVPSETIGRKRSDSQSSTGSNIHTEIGEQEF